MRSRIGLTAEEMRYEVGRTLHRVGAVVVGLVTVVLLAGCRPISSGWMAVRLAADDELKVIISICEGEPVSLITMVDLGANTDDGEVLSGTWAVTAPPPPDAQTQPQREFTIFRAPAGWTVQEDDLRPLSDDKEYAVSAMTYGYSRSSDQAGPRRTDVKFRLEDLRALDDDQVLVSTPDGEGEVITVQEFEQDAHDQCH
ncbi:hypothetical protein ABN034_07680 [Actinopolymorpha sp. B11F2]|uniref:hypothetical protein n=1 Tax=Actinopolymorpha sp. B11F2 TaxID=3160862 RepID=UPI0032E46FC3